MAKFTKQSENHYLTITVKSCKIKLHIFKGFSPCALCLSTQNDLMVKKDWQDFIQINVKQSVHISSGMNMHLSQANSVFLLRITDRQITLTICVVIFAANEEGALFLRGCCIIEGNQGRWQHIMRSPCTCKRKKRTRLTEAT